TGHERLDPRVGIVVPDDVVLSVRIPFPPLEPVHDPRWNAEGPEHHRHRRREVLAVAGPPHEEELLEWVELAHALDVERVAELGPQELLHAVRDLLGRLARA